MSIAATYGCVHEFDWILESQTYLSHREFRENAYLKHIQYAIFSYNGR